MPLTETFFAERFGMVADKFGVSWMILVQEVSCSRRELAFKGRSTTSARMPYLSSPEVNHGT